jgi:hypothetical protein
MEIKNKDLLRSLKFACGKFKDADELTEEDLEKIYELNINELSVTGRNSEIDLKEVPELPNLRRLSLKNFVISDDEIEFINKNKRLIDLSFDRCVFDSRKSYIASTTLKALSMRYCDNISALRYIAPERLRILGMDRVNVAAIRGIERVNYLNLQSSRIYRLDALRRCPELKELHLDGADYSPTDEEYIEVIQKNPRIKVTREEYYQPTM